MTESSFDMMQSVNQRIWRMLSETSQRSSILHRQFLHTRQNGLNDMARLIALQIQPGSATSHPATARRALFDECQLDAFGTGNLSDCLGSAFAVYDNRRIPRIPNGDLKMMSRVVEIEGRAGDFSTPASIVVEYDVPANAWYLRDNTVPEVPYSLWMEIALQPCGFLSAYLDTYALVPYEAYYFRNLDGTARLLSRLDPRGKTITTRARMLTSVVSGGTVIQKFAFELYCDNVPLYAGESTFGYFSVESMTNQVGLDGCKPAQPWLRSPEGARQTAVTFQADALRASAPELRLSSGQLHFLDSVTISRNGGRYGQGYVYAGRPVNPEDWFYPFHFYQDPVMPGSLGVESILEAMQYFAVASQMQNGLRSPRFSLPADIPDFTWRYRGQITPRHNLMELEAHLKAPERRAGGLVLLADASLWVDGLRIYEVKNAAVGLLV